MSNSFLSGNTIRLKCTFCDFVGKEVDPDIVKIKLYDYRYKIIEEHALTEAHKLLTGNYFFDFIIPNDIHYFDKTIYYEFYGEIEGTPSLNRGSFKIQFI